MSIIYDDDECGPDCVAVMCCINATVADRWECGCGGGLDHSDCPGPASSVDEDDITALLKEAEAAGDNDMVSVCMTALGPTSADQKAAWRACVDAIEVARAMDDE